VSDSVLRKGVPPMEWSDFHRCEDIQQLMAQGALQQGSAAYSIARQAIDLGFATLSARQRYILDQVTAPNTCAR